MAERALTLAVIQDAYERLLVENQRYISTPMREADMATLSDAEQCREDQQSGLEMDRHQARRGLRPPVPTAPPLWFMAPQGVEMVEGGTMPPPPTYTVGTWHVETTNLTAPDPPSNWGGTGSSQISSSWQIYWDHAPKHLCMACAEEVVVYLDGSVRSWSCEGCGITRGGDHVIDPTELSAEEAKLIHPDPDEQAKRKKQRYMEACSNVSNLTGANGGTSNG